MLIDDTVCDPSQLTGGVYPAKYPTQQSWQNAQVSFITTVGNALKAAGYYVVANSICYIPGNPGDNDASLTAAWGRLGSTTSLAVRTSSAKS